MLALQGTVYHFRRRVPERLKAALGLSEIWISLNTSVKQVARARACLLYALSQGLFDRAGDMDDAEAKRELWQLKIVHRQLEHEAEQAKVLNDLLARAKASAAGVQRIGGRLAETRATNKALMEALRDGAGVKAPEAKESPLFDANTDAFLADKQRAAPDHRPWSNQSAAQARATFRLWTEIVGLKPVREYTKADAGHFRDQVLKLPASHSKDGGGTSALELIERNKVDRKPVLTMKTAKRHFSALNQYWKWLETRGHVDGTIFSGFSFPGTKSSRKKRDDWSPEDLRRLFTSDWYMAPDADRDAAFWWLPLIALHSGMRVEEIARLRTIEDIQEIDGLPCFVLQEHPDWTPKTEAGERVVPIHSRLAELGLLGLVERRRRSHCYRLFPDLNPSGPDKKLSTEFSRKFSKHKAALGVGRKTCFHSFRHSVRTMLANTEAELRDIWIDSLMGHAADEKSEGERTYTKRISVKFLRRAVDAIQPEVDLGHLLRCQK